jgi:hypothetical protein
MRLIRSLLPAAASVDDANMNEYCSIDADGKRTAPLTLGEKEQAFLEALAVRPTALLARWSMGGGQRRHRSACAARAHALVRPLRCLILLLHLRLQSFYYDGKPAMSNEEFDLLKDELVWSGSKVAVLRCRVLRSRAGWVGQAAAGRFPAQAPELGVWGSWPCPPSHHFAPMPACLPACLPACALSLQL